MPICDVAIEIGFFYPDWQEVWGLFLGMMLKSGDDARAILKWPEIKDAVTFSIFQAPPPNPHSDFASPLCKTNHYFLTVFYFYTLYSSHALCTS